MLSYRLCCPKTLTEEDLILLTINHILLGRNSTQAISYNPKGKLVGTDGLEQKVRTMLHDWWKQ